MLLTQICRQYLKLVTKLFRCLHSFQSFVTKIDVCRYKLVYDSIYNSYNMNLSTIQKKLTNETGMISVGFVKGSFNIKTHFVKNLKIQFFFQKICSEMNSSDQRRPEEDKSDTKSEREKMRSLNLSSDDFEIEKSKLPQ